MGRAKQPRRVNRYTLEFKLSAVQLSKLRGVQIQDVAQALDIHPFMLSRWRKEARGDGYAARAARSCSTPDWSESCVSSMSSSSAIPCSKRSTSC